MGVCAVRPGRVVVLSDVSWPLGGAEALALKSARLLAEAGVPVTFIAGDTAEKCPLDRAVIEVIALGGSPLLDRDIADRGLAGIHNTKAQRLMTDFIRDRDQPDTIYHMHNWSQIMSPAVFHALRPVADRLFLSAHDYALVCPNLSYSNYQKGGEICTLKPLGLSCLTTHCDRRAYSHKLWRSVRSVALKMAIDLGHTRALVSIIHPMMTDYYVRGGIARDRIRVLRNPVQPYSRERIPAEANQDILFVGRVVHEKGVDLAAEAARMVGRRLRVVGDGPLRAELAARYPEVVFEGWKTHPEISALARQARCVVVPSRLPEMFTLVAHEAMRAGLPVVAFSDVDGQEAADLGGAIVVPPREASSLAEGLRRLDDDAAVERISRIAFEQCAQFSNTDESWRDAMLACYAELLAQAASGRQHSAMSGLDGSVDAGRAGPTVAAG